MSAVEKLCVVCGEDVAGKKRTKDARGQYYCEPCFQGRLKETRSTAPQAQAAGAAVAELTAPPPTTTVAAPEPADDGMLDLAPEPKTASAKDTPMAACATCKKLLPERQVRDLDGEFICNPCFARRNQGKATSPAGRKPPMAKAVEVEASASGEVGFADSLMGGGFISLGILVAAFFLFFGFNTMWPGKDDGGAGIHFIAAAVETVYIGIRAVSLIVSMVVAARILGGISFGYIGSAVYKSLGFFAGLTLLELFMGRFETFAMIGFGLKFILIGGAFMLLFKIDAFEAFLLSVVNTAISWILGILLLIVLVTSVRHSSSSHDSGDDDFQDGPAQVAPDNANPKVPNKNADAQPDAQPKPVQQPAADGGG